MWRWATRIKASFHRLESSFWTVHLTKAGKFCITEEPSEAGMVIGLPYLVLSFVLLVFGFCHRAMVTIDLPQSY
jgi:hypothetical protein